MPRSSIPRNFNILIHLPQLETNGGTVVRNVNLSILEVSGVPRRKKIPRWQKIKDLDVYLPFRPGRAVEKTDQIVFLNKGMTSVYLRERRSSHAQGELVNTKEGLINGK